MRQVTLITLLLAIAGEAITILDGRGRPVARVGQPIRLDDGAMESPSTMAAFDELIPGLPWKTALVLIGFPVNS